MVEQQREDSGRREADEVSDARSVDVIEHRGFDDVIDEPDAAEPAV